MASTQLIKLYMQREILIGNIYLASTPEARILDTLNGLADKDPVKKEIFLELYDVTIAYSDGREEKLINSYINKSNVQLAITLGDVDVGRGLGANKGFKSYPFVEKSPLSVKIKTQDYLIVGYMHHLPYQNVRQVIEGSPPFLPITHAQIQILSNSTQEFVPFVAVHKKHIRSLQELNDNSKTGEIENQDSSKKCL